MEQNSLLAKITQHKQLLLIIGAVVVLGALAAFALLQKPVSDEPLRVGISPYQDIAMTAAIKPLGLEEKYHTKVELLTLPWEDILPAVTSAGEGVDIGFASYIEYLTKADNINAGSDDPLLFVYPMYVFKGGAFVTFESEDKVPTLDAASLKNRELVAKFLGSKIGAQKSSLYDMMLYSLASANGVDPKSINIIDTPMDQGFLAAEAGSLDAAEVGLTQLTEAQQRGGRAVLTMEDLGFADITGIVVKKSVLEAKRPQIEAFVKMWFDSVDYVYTDIDNNSRYSLDYLDKNASTKYSVSSYKTALTQEYLPRSIEEAEKELIADDGKYSYKRIGDTVQTYLLTNGVIKSKTPIPVPINVR